MNILALNTSFAESYVALKTANKTVLNHMDSSLKQSENILGLMHKTLAQGGVEIKDINSIAVVIGPGSFTGIRIGASIAKGICTAIPNIKKICINSLDLIAYSFAKTNPNTNFWVVLNALSGNLFVCSYDQNGQRISEPILANGETIDQICGSVVGIEEENLSICNNMVSLTSDDLLEYSLILNESKIYSTDFVPVYMRKSQAEENVGS